MRYLTLICFEMMIVPSLILALYYVPKNMYSTCYQFLVVTWLLAPFFCMILAIVYEVLDWKRERLEIFMRVIRVAMLIVFVCIQLLFLFLLSQQ